MVLNVYVVYGFSFFLAILLVFFIFVFTFRLCVLCNVYDACNKSRLVE